MTQSSSGSASFGLGTRTLAVRDLASTFLRRLSMRVRRMSIFDSNATRLTVLLDSLELLLEVAGGELLERLICLLGRLAGGIG